MSSEPVLQLETLSAGYDAAAVVRALDLHVGSGEVVALLGPNGAGKTTTLRAISGLVRPMSGTIRVDGADIARRSPAARAASESHTGLGSGACFSFFGLTVAEHFVRLPGAPRSEVDFEYFRRLAARRRRAGLLSAANSRCAR